ncbi:MAG: sigma-70 family RNA polymerase sigma factor [Bacillota bacterium]|nr:sigma-70 family RNA polymerase sigma factor [Bacillota bacterium]
MFKKSEYKQSPDSFEKYYETYYKTVFKHVAYITGNIQAAEDITQETFIKLYDIPPSHSNVAAWLIKVSTNLSYNFIRGDKIRKEKDPAVAENEATNVISIEDAAIRNMEIRSIKKVLDSLNPRDRLCILLKFSGYKYDEIAEIAGIEKASVGKTLARAQAKFKDKYVTEVL